MSGSWFASLLVLSCWVSSLGSSHLMNKRGFVSGPNDGGGGSSTEAAAPSFKLESNTSLITSAGQTAYFHCLVENLGDREVSWIRRSDLKILTIGDILYTQDKRFQSLHESGSEVWMLKVTDARLDDSGEYECQISYHEDMEKKMKLTFKLNVLDSRAVIHESPDDLHVQVGSRLRLSCSISAPSAPPTYVYWYRDDQVLNYAPDVTIVERLDISVDPYKEYKLTTNSVASSSLPRRVGRAKTIVVSGQPALLSGEEGVTSSSSSAALFSDANTMVSSLSIEGVRGRNSGNYTCAPSNAKQVSVLVHVVNDESGPAAMQHGNHGPISRAAFWPLATLVSSAVIYTMLL